MAWQTNERTSMKRKKQELGDLFYPQPIYPITLHDPAILKYKTGEFIDEKWMQNAFALLYEKNFFVNEQIAVFEEDDIKDWNAW